MNPITMLSNVPHDKALHVVAGSLTYVGCHLLQLGDKVCLAATVAVGVGKEVVYDHWLHLGNADRWDAIATGMGGLLGYAVTIQF